MVFRPPPPACPGPSPAYSHPAAGGRGPFKRCAQEASPSGPHFPLELICRHLLPLFRPDCARPTPTPRSPHHQHPWDPSPLPPLPAVPSPGSQPTHLLPVFAPVALGETSPGEQDTALLPFPVLFFSLAPLTPDHKVCPSHAGSFVHLPRLERDLHEDRGLVCLVHCCVPGTAHRACRTHEALQKYVPRNEWTPRSNLGPPGLACPRPQESPTCPGPPWSLSLLLEHTVHLFLPACLQVLE